MKNDRFNTRPSFRPVIFTVCLLVLINLLCLIQTMALNLDKMSNKEAENLLNSHEMFAAKQTVILNIGTIHARLAEVEKYQPIYTTFKAMGLVELTSVKIESRDKDPSKSTEGTRVSLTEKGFNESKSWKQERENSWAIVIADRQLVEIIKIHRDEKTIHGIEFSWTWVPNKIGEALKFSHQIERAYAKLEHEGNGWHIVKIRAL